MQWKNKSDWFIDWQSHWSPPHRSWRCRPRLRRSAPSRAESCGSTWASTWWSGCCRTSWSLSRWSPACFWGSPPPGSPVWSRTGWRRWLSQKQEINLSPVTWPSDPVTQWFVFQQLRLTTSQQGSYMCSCRSYELASVWFYGPSTIIVLAVGYYSVFLHRSYLPGTLRCPLIGFYPPERICRARFWRRTPGLLRGCSDAGRRSSWQSLWSRRSECLRTEQSPSDAASACSAPPWSCTTSLLPWEQTRSETNPHFSPCLSPRKSQTSCWNIHLVTPSVGLMKSL